MSLSAAHAWLEEMDRAFKQDFTDLDTVMTCCGQPASLNDLNYDWPAGFARFRLASQNPNRGWLTPDELTTISAALRHPVRQILARY
ncbi:hypothetical protein ACX1DX_00905 [Tessaracoccus sp. Y36]